MNWNDTTIVSWEPFPLLWVFPSAFLSFRGPASIFFTSLTILEISFTILAMHRAPKMSFKHFNMTPWNRNMPNAQYNSCHFCTENHLVLHLKDPSVQHMKYFARCFAVLKYWYRADNPTIVVCPFLVSNLKGKIRKTWIPFNWCGHCCNSCACNEK